jgi:hypothetical protein
MPTGELGAITANRARNKITIWALLSRHMKLIDQLMVELEVRFGMRKEWVGLGLSGALYMVPKFFDVVGCWRRAKGASGFDCADEHRYSCGCRTIIVSSRLVLFSFPQI